jgi:hypothetical protein
MMFEVYYTNISILKEMRMVLTSYVESILMIHCSESKYHIILLFREYIVRLLHNAIFRWLPLYFITLQNNHCCVPLRKFISKFIPQCLQVFEVFTFIIFSTFINKPKKLIFFSRFLFFAPSNFLNKPSHHFHFWLTKFQLGIC